jgi:2-keto-4-pentenoate hydratase/2-oxohepta-3-ene-1,7-dioic acid hydratase in catechol pathway
MKLVTVATSQGAQAGVLRGEEVVLLADTGFQSMIEIVAAGDLKAIAGFAASTTGEAILPLASARLLAPIPRPPKLICVGLNYRDHAKECGLAIPTVPTIFNKFPNTVIGPGDPIVLPRNSSQPDYEAEFAFVIGKGGRHIPARRWREHVFGYMNLNDVSARDFQMATSQWLMGKTFDTFAPTGPWLVTADEVPDPHKLAIHMTVSGELLQESNTSNLIFGVPELIEHLSSVVTLEPGDIVSTGTPGGVGFVRKPPRYLRPGDECVVEVENLGRLRNPVVAE